MSLPSGQLHWRKGVVTSSADSLQIRIFGRGAHGSMPEASIDPVVMAASTVIRLQTIVSREVAPTDSAVVTIGVLQAGTKENVIPDDAIIKLNVRTFDERVRRRVLAAIERIVNAEAAAAGAPKPPVITQLDRYSSVTNDGDATEKVVEAFRHNFPDGSVAQTKPTMASEDFGCFGSEWQVPAVYWFFGGADPETYAKASREGTVSSLPTNHNPRFAPVIHPTLETGVKALVVAAHAWLGS
jgi:hippurate hydrolase